MVEHPRCGGAVGSDRLRLGPGPAAVHPGRRAPARVGPRVGRHRAGAVPRGVSTRQWPADLGRGAVGLVSFFSPVSVFERM